MSSSTNDDPLGVIIAIFAGVAIVLFVLVWFARSIGESMANMVGSTCPTGPVVREGNALFLLNGAEGAGEGAARVLDGWLAFGELLVVLGLIGMLAVYLFFRYRGSDTNSYRARRARHRGNFWTPRRIVYAVPALLLVVGVGVVAVLFGGGYAGAECIEGLGHIL